MIFVKRDSPKCALRIKEVGGVWFKYLVRFKSGEVEDYLSGSEWGAYRMAMKILGQPLLAHVGDLRGKRVHERLMATLRSSAGPLCNIIAAKNNKNTRLNLSYLKLLLIPFWNLSVNVSVLVCGFGNFLWILIILPGCEKRWLFAFWKHHPMVQLLNILISVGSASLYVTEAVTDILWGPILYHAAMKLPTRSTFWCICFFLCSVVTAGAKPTLVSERVWYLLRPPQIISS